MAGAVSRREVLQSAVGALATWMASRASARAAPHGPRAMVAPVVPLLQVCPAKRCSQRYGDFCIGQAIHNETRCRDACNTAYCRGRPCVPSSSPLDIQCCQCLNTCQANRAREQAACNAEYDCAPGCGCGHSLEYQALFGGNPAFPPNDPRFPTAFFGTCCPPGQSTCKGQCVDPRCQAGAYYDVASCSCRCSPRACSPVQQQNPATCACECRPLSCPPGFHQDPATCRCECPPCSGLMRPDPNTCQCICPSPFTNCSGVCVDTAISPTNCGSCGRVCIQGVEECCQGQCRQLGTDSNCRTCGDVCPGGTSPPWGCCNRQCVPLDTVANCDVCGRRCLGGKECRNGNCACPFTHHDCNGVCRNLQRDPANCGTCGCVCPPGSTCQAGMCTCSSGLSLCGGPCAGRCRNLDNDPFNCGACGHVCRGGAAVNPATGARTPYEGHCAGGHCVCQAGFHPCPTPDVFCAPNTHPVCCPPNAVNSSYYGCSTGTVCCNSGLGCCWP